MDQTSTLDLAMELDQAPFNHLKAVGAICALHFYLCTNHSAQLRQFVNHLTKLSTTPTIELSSTRMPNDRAIDRPHQHLETDPSNLIASWSLSQEVDQP